MLKTFGEKLREVRISQNLTQKQLAEKMGVTPTRLNYWEKDKREPNIEMIRNLASVLKVPVSELLDMNEERLAREAQNLDATVTYCEKMGFQVEMRASRWHWEDESEPDPSKRVQIADEWEITMSRDGLAATFTEAEFVQMQAGAQEAIEGRFFRKVLEQQKRR